MMKVLGDNRKKRLPELAPINFDDSNWNNESLNVAYSNNLNDIALDAEYLEIFNAFIDKLKETSHQFRKKRPIYNEKKAFETWGKILGFEMGVNSPKIPLLMTGMYSFIMFKYRDHSWAKSMALGQRLSNLNYAKAIDYKDKVAKIYDEFLTEFDIWITPVCPIEAYKHQPSGKPFKINNKKVPYIKAIGSYTITSALSGHPIVVVPIGKKKNGMPVGIQIHSKKWSDKKLLEIAKYFEQFTDGFEIPKRNNCCQ